MAITDEHLQELRAAKARLETIPFHIKAANAVGQPLERTLASLPRPAQEAIQKATTTALERGLDWAVATVGSGASGTTRPRPWLHRAVVTASGGVGGAFGWGALAAELPFSTVVILRQIALIAQRNGEDPRDAATRLQCLAVLSYGGTSPDDDAAETTYYATRTALATSLQRAAAQLTTAIRGGDAPRTARFVTGFLGKVAGRFGLVVQEKAVAQAIPVIGAVGGATLNNLFIAHFATVAEGHFTVRRLERIYGEAVVREAYEGIRV